MRAQAQSCMYHYEPSVEATLLHPRTHAGIYCREFCVCCTHVSRDGCRESLTHTHTHTHSHTNKQTNKQTNTNTHPTPPARAQPQRSQPTVEPVRARAVKLPSVTLRVSGLSTIVHDRFLRAPCVDRCGRTCVWRTRTRRRPWRPRWTRSSTAGGRWVGAAPPDGRLATHTRRRAVL
jgi:hypothetical protein